MNYKQKYLKYKQKYLQTKNQLGGNYYDKLFTSDLIEKEVIDSSTLKIKFMDVEYIVIFYRNFFSFKKNDDVLLDLAIVNNVLNVDMYQDCFDLLKKILEIYNLDYCEINIEFENDDPFTINDDLFVQTENEKKKYIFLNANSPNYEQVKDKMTPMRLKIFNHMTLEKRQANEHLYFIFDGTQYEILEDDKSIVIKTSSSSDFILKFKIIDTCVHYILVEEYNNSKNVLDLILKINNYLFSLSDHKICEECINFYNKYIYINNTNKLYCLLKNVLSPAYNTKLGISNDLLKPKLYSINFMWVRTHSYTEKCFSINGNLDTFTNINTIENILKLQSDEFFNKLITFSKNNPNALTNFWIDATQLNISTLINLRLIFDIFNINLGTNLCVRDVWSLEITNTINLKYPNILPKCSGFSLILKVDLYKCIICVEELTRHTYSIFADIDMLPIGEDEILSSTNVDILNRVGLILPKIAPFYENSFQILGSTVEHIRKSVILSFDIMMIEQTMLILQKMQEKKFNNERFKGESEQLIYILYEPMYKFLYFACGYGMYYVNGKKINYEPLLAEDFDSGFILEEIKDNADIFIKNKMLKYDILENFGNYISYELFESGKKINESFPQEINEIDLLEMIKKYTTDDLIKKYCMSLCATHMKKLVPIEDRIIRCAVVNKKFIQQFPVKDKDLILFADPHTLKKSTCNWPFTMCKKYIQNNF
jgi:hypothetical protein